MTIFASPELRQRALAAHATQDDTLAFTLGQLCAEHVLSQLPDGEEPALTVACAAPDADGLARGFIETLEHQRPEMKVSFVCLWTDIIDTVVGSTGHIWREYKEPSLSDQVKSTVVYLTLVGLADTVTTYALMRLGGVFKNHRTWMVSPWVLNDTDEEVTDAFDAEVTCHSLLHDADTDTTLSMPHPGFELPTYPQRLGWQPMHPWVRETMPAFVRERRARAFPRNQT